MRVVRFALSGALNPWILLAIVLLPMWIPTWFSPLVFANT